MTESPTIETALRALLLETSATKSAAARICAACSDLLPVSGAAISVVADGGIRGTVCASDAVMRRIEDLQFLTGVGPCVDAIAAGSPVLVPVLDNASEARWPGFAIEAHQAGAQAIFALPLNIGAIRLGAIDLYRDTPGGLSSRQVADALLVAEAATLAVINMHERRPADDLDDYWWDVSSFFRIEIHQATGMLMHQLGVSAVDALARLRGRAFADGVAPATLAREIVSREIDLTQDQQGRSDGGASRDNE